VNGFREAWDSIKKRIGEMSVNQRLVLGMVTAGVIISTAVFSFWLGQEESAVLFSNLSAEDANVALEELTKLDVPAELANGGTTIMVPASQVHRLRVKLASEGIPSSGVVGFEIFDKNRYGMTDKDFELQHQRALQGELTKTIESLRGVEVARVHLVMPKSSIFRALATQPTASVVLTLNRQLNLSKNQITGIQSLVAGSVEGLNNDNVTVLDQNGQALSDSYANDTFGASDRQLQLKKEVEEYLGDKAQTMLSSVLGTGKSLVRVDATLNFERIESERTIFDPKNQVIRSEERNESSGGEGTGTTETSMTNYEINQTVEHIVGETGGVKTLSVAVFVDGSYEVPAEGGEPVYQPLPADQLENIQRVVQRAVGLSLERGDQIEVVNIQFNDQTVTETNGGPLPVGIIDMVLEYGGKVVLVIILGVLVMTFRKSLSGALSDIISSSSSNPELAAVAGAGGAATEDDTERFDGLPEMTDQMIEDVREYAAENPERVAEVVQSWMYEPENSGR